MDKETSEIAKLTERIEKDPKSKLFVPLAEEYKKAGDMEMAIHVLTEGLKNNPGYVTAKAFLGRLLFEKGDLAAAKKEFDEVVRAIPDNLLAQRKLGDIFALQEENVTAISHYSIVLSLNPGDEEVTSLVDDLKAGRSVKERLLQKKAAPGGTSHPENAPVPPGGKTQKPGSMPMQNVMPQGEIREEPEEVLIVEPLGGEVPAMAGMGAAFDAGLASEPSVQPVYADAEPSGGALSLDKAFQVSADVPGMADIDVLSGSGAPSQEFASPAAPPADDFSTNTLAELYISQGFHEKAIDIYEKMVAENPGNQALQDKLDQVRAMAGQAIPAGEQQAGASLPPVEPESWPGVPQPSYDLGADLASDSVPPSLETSVPSFDAGPDEQPSSVSPGRKATILRLESWLKNIVKEKQK